MNDDTENNGGKLDGVGDHGAVGQVHQVIGEPQKGADQRCQTVISAVLLYNGEDETEGGQHGDQVESRFEHQQIDCDKGQRIDAHQPQGNLLIFAVEEVADEALGGTDKAGACAVVFAGQQIAGGHEGIGKNHEQENQLHVFALNKRGGADTYGTKHTENNGNHTTRPFLWNFVKTTGHVCTSEMYYT